MFKTIIFFSKDYIYLNNVKKKKLFKLSLFLFFIFLFFIFFFILTNIKIKNLNENLEINEPILPQSNEDHIIKKFSKSKFNSSHIRYRFQDCFNKRKLFKINYSYFPYKKINKLISFDENAEIIYRSTGMINLTKLEYYYNNIDVNTKNFNHIHLSMSFDNNYIELASISIASILNTSNSDTYIHFHILCLNFKFEDMKKIIQLKKINKNVNFIFYNAKQAEYDFGERAKNEWRGVGNYAKILAPQIVNNTNKILIIDSGDIIAQKDISEIFYYDIEDNYFGWILEDIAGNYKNKIDSFFSNNFYQNAGVCLVNIRLFRKDELYKKAFFISISYRNLDCPFQDILISISIYKFKYFPLKYNSMIFFDNDEQMKNKRNNTKIIQEWNNAQKYSPFKYTIEEILDAAYDPVIIHYYHKKIYNGCFGCNIFTIQWIKYAKLTGLYEDIKLKFPQPFECEK